MKHMLATVLTLVLAMSGPTAEALEKRAVPLDGRLGGSDWAVGVTTCRVTYTNTCTGWLWTWSGWSSTDVVGEVFEYCCQSSPLRAATNFYVWSGSPSGYGFTGTISVWNADLNDCPAGLLGSAALLPVSGSNINVWNVPSTGDIVLTYQLGSSAFPNPLTLPTDHPAAGPTGPQACGLCYPSTRTIHSFYYGNATSPLCPGSTLNDGTCDAEWLFSAASYRCLISVDDDSWGAVKNLYR